MSVEPHQEADRTDHGGWPRLRCVGVCGLASIDYGLTSLRAATAPDNLASQAVLTRVGFVLAGSVELDGQPEVRLVRDLTVDGTGRPADR